jgi:hypothetical protein
MAVWQEPYFRYGYSIKLGIFLARLERLCLLG